MTVLRPRNRLVNFRLSEDEYQALKEAYLLKGARSISEYARSAVLASVGNADRPEWRTQNRQANLSRRVAELEERVMRLLGLLGDGVHSEDSKTKTGA